MAEYNDNTSLFNIENIKDKNDSWYIIDDMLDMFSKNDNISEEKRNILILTFLKEKDKIWKLIREKLKKCILDIKYENWELNFSYKQRKSIQNLYIEISESKDWLIKKKIEEFKKSLSNLNISIDKYYKIIENSELKVSFVKQLCGELINQINLLHNKILNLLNDFRNKESELKKYWIINLSYLEEQKKLILNKRANIFWSSINYIINQKQQSENV